MAELPSLHVECLCVCVCVRVCVHACMRKASHLRAWAGCSCLQGASKNLTYQEWDKIWTMNKRVIDPVVPRHTGVEKPGRVTVRLSNGPREPEVSPLMLSLRVTASHWSMEGMRFLCCCLLLGQVGAAVCSRHCCCYCCCCQYHHNFCPSKQGDTPDPPVSFHCLC